MRATAFVKGILTSPGQPRRRCHRNPHPGTRQGGAPTRAARLPRTATGMPMAAALVALAAMTLWAAMMGADAAGAGTGSGAGRLAVHFIDVGQGDSILILAPSGKTMLIDGGPADASERLIAYLKEQEVAKIDVLVATHPHADHIGGLVEVLRAFPVGLVVDSGKVHTTATYERFLTLIDQKNIRFRLGRAGDSIDLGPGFAARILHPTEPLPENMNDCSVVVRLEYGKVSFLFTGDAERDAENAMLKSGADLRAAVLKVAHHGSRTSSSPWFLKAAKPAVAVILVGAGNSYGHPHRITLLNLADYTDRVYRTDVDGDVVVTTDGTTFRVDTARGGP
ncbi:MAG: ComEC/Rec2 family competence protein [Bacillota bacterium]|nr:ComEC/Rec2 family competence protein [Bacillota bacterium]